jgi:hypothetical protein
MRGEKFRDNCAEGQLSPEGNELPVLACEFGPSDVPWNLFEAPIVCLVMLVTKRDRWESTSQRASNV